MMDDADEEEMSPLMLQWAEDEYARIAAKKTDDLSDDDLALALAISEALLLRKDKAQGSSSSSGILQQHPSPIRQEQASSCSSCSSCSSSSSSVARQESVKEEDKLKVRPGSPSARPRFPQPQDPSFPSLRSST